MISIHSAEFVDDEGLELMKARGCVFVPTIAWLRFRVDEEYARRYTRAWGFDEAGIRRFLDECREAREAARGAIARAFRVGTPMGIGSDAAHVFPPYDVVAEMQCFQELGVPPLEILTCATRNSARAIGRGDQWGTLEPGKAADLLVVDGDPAADVGVLRDKSRIALILQDGRAVKDAMGGAARAV